MMITVAPGGSTIQPRTKREVKPWLPMEIKEQRTIDIPATERLDILRKYWYVFQNL